MVLPDPNPDILEFSLIAKKEPPSSVANSTPDKDKGKSTSPDSDTETISTLDLCHENTKKQTVSLSTYVVRNNSLKPQLEKLNSKSAETVSDKLARESKRRKIQEVTLKLTLIQPVIPFFSL
jgi:hypothetical protein